MIEFELNNQALCVSDGTTILEAALQHKTYIPHFCYHKKLSIAANCRMCLVEVEKSRGPVTACSTPVTAGMKVHTNSKLTKDSQQGVMELLLINHPLDCPICDQGGECQLQDLAVGYGNSHSRFTENKRVVVNEDLGPLIRSNMTRCIHCSRCIRFSDEIAGHQELAFNYRNNHVAVMPFTGKTVNSELSGNMIDICPVGALTSKPYQDIARPWELSRRKTIAPHDSLGSNLIAQTDKYHKIVRILPFDNEDINQCWISDRDRFSYEGLYHAERAVEPLIKINGEWQPASWQTALEHTTQNLTTTEAKNIGVLASAISTTEELFLLQKMLRVIGIQNLDHRLDQTDFLLDQKHSGVQYLGCSIAELLAEKSLLVVGCLLRDEQPLLTARLRAADEMAISFVSPIAQDIYKAPFQQLLVPDMSYVLLQILQAIAQLSNASITAFNLTAIMPTAEAISIAHNLLENKGSILLGRIARELADYSLTIALAQHITALSGGKLCFLPSLANDVGAKAVSFMPRADGLNTQAMLESKLSTYLLLNTELEHDVINKKLALSALQSAKNVIVMSAYTNSAMLDYANIILPITPFSETAGSYINMAGTWQQFNAVTKPYLQSQPAWKVIGALAKSLGVFDYDNIKAIRNDLSILLGSCHYSNIYHIEANFELTCPRNHDHQYCAKNIYASDSIVRRATSLQQTVLAQRAI